ncbi:futalosine hydrolase [Paenibacillus phyllosphaerae]|uniref:Futalosine hydrolase n=1 Tax=Paenibacillus phyllosphaerae TaxID=274593 RepID=A0A7W5B356_9BACL|nr:futalosine hydrolase [Paenibacillus phyllosphaerae]MBB3113554.1 futalosine hydrolase [Paenibacillus phyllosphaerae]
MAVNERILIVTSVEAEREAIRRGIGDTERFEVAVVGVGSASAAAGTAAALANGSYRLVINAGIGGGFAGQADIGTLVIASECVAADLGAETADGFVLIDELGFGSARIQTESQLSDSWQMKLGQAGITSIVAPIVTVTTVTGTASTASKLETLVPGAAAEAMEGFGAATAAKLFATPFIEIRAISNAVGPRNREDWRIKDALMALEAASKVLVEVV